MQCSGYRFKTTTRAYDKTSWDDALFDFHVPILPARIVVSLCDKQNLFGTTFGALKVTSEVTLQLNEQRASASNKTLSLLTPANAEFGKVSLSWNLSHNSAIATLTEMKFTEQPCGVPSKRAPYSVFVGTWNLGNGRPSPMSQKNGLGWLDAAFACDIVAIGSQESLYTTEMLRDALKEGPLEPASPGQAWSMVDVVQRLRDPGGITHKMQLVDKKKRK